MQDPGFFFKKKMTMHPGECFEKVQSCFGLYNVLTDLYKKEKQKVQFLEVKRSKGLNMR